jgi:hypothetical protein
MKQLALAIVSAVAISGAAFAQGTVNWSSLNPAAFTAQTNSILLSPLFGGGSSGLGAGAGGGNSGFTGTAATGFYYELLYSATFTGSQLSGGSAPSNSFANLFGGTWQDTGLSATNTTSSFGRGVPIAGNTGATVPWANGITNNIIIVGWSANLGTSWLVVSNELANWTSTYEGTFVGNSFFGVTAAGFINPGSSNPGVAVTGTSAGSQGLPVNSPATPLYLLPVPEPSTMALAGLSGLSLLLFRRRKV